jgi:tetratricopeptide (TPR) repeat protein
MRESPYRGLEPFTEDDRRYFFGRSKEITTIAANLLTAPLTILYGATGVGKSSIIMAGVVPFVRDQRDTTVILFRSWQDPQLSTVLNGTVAEVIEKSHHAAPPARRDFASYLAAAAATIGDRLTLIFDQFEEFLRYHPAHTLSGQTFDRELARLINTRDVPANILISVREDAVANLDRFQRHIPEFLSNMVRLHHLSISGGRQAITEPLRQYNEDLRCNGMSNTEYSVEPELTESILRQVQSDAVDGEREGLVRPRSLAEVGEAAIETPLLQLILTPLWEEETRQGSPVLRFETLRRLGNATSIVSSYVETTIADLDDRQKDICAAIFDRLAMPSGNKNAYTVSYLITIARRDPDEVQAVLTLLSGKNRLLREVGGPSELRYEIFHDVLAFPLLRWTTEHTATTLARRRARDFVFRWFALIGAALVAVAICTLTYQLLDLRKQHVRDTQRIDAATWLDEARVFNATGKPEEAAQKLLKAVSVYGPLHEQAGLTAVTKVASELRDSGLREYAARHYMPAVTYFRASEAVAIRTRNVSLQAEALLLVALCELSLDRDEEAELTLKNLDALLESAPNEEILSPAGLTYLALVGTTLGRSDRALLYLTRASKTDDPSVMAFVQLQTGQIQYVCGDYGSARNAYERAYANARTCNNFDIAVRSLVRLTELARLQNDQSAVKRYELALQNVLRQPERFRGLLHTSLSELALGW